MLYSFPESLDRILFRKTLLWAFLSLIYPCAVLAWALSYSQTFNLGMLINTLTVFAGVFIYALIAGGIGVLATDPSQELPNGQKKISVLSIYLFMMVASMYSLAIYSDEISVKTVAMALSIILACSIWQKVKDHCPYFLDPVENPPTVISMSDGLTAVIAFSGLQTLFQLFLSDVTELTPGNIVWISFSSSGLVTALACLLIFAYRKTPDLLETVGIRIKNPPDSKLVMKSLLEIPAVAAPLAGTFTDGTSVATTNATPKTDSFSKLILRNSFEGVIFGIIALLIGLAYVRAASLYEPVRLAISEASQIAVSSKSGMIWMIVAMVIAAPLFEEFIFRGVLFNGMKRSMGLWAAIFGSAAIFAMIHPPLSLIPVFIMGISATICFNRNKCLLAPILVHSIYNAGILYFS